MQMKAARNWSLGLAAWLALAAPSQALQIFTEEWPPLTFTRKGVPDGMVVEVVEEIQARQKDRAPIRVVPWSRAYQTVSHVPGSLLFAVLRTPEREKRFTLLGPVAISENVLYARRGSPLKIRSVEDARRVKRITTQKDAAYEETLRRLGFTNLDIASSPQNSARKLLAGRVELWSDSNLTAPYHLRKIGRRPDEIERKLLMERQEIHLAFSRGTSAAVIRRWFGTLRAMQRDGTLTRIHRRWLPNAASPQRVKLVGLPPGTPMPD